MKLFVNSMSHYIPSGIRPNSYFKTLNGLDDDWIYQRTGIKTRSFAGPDENTNTMALKAVEKAIKSIPYDVKDVDLIVTATYSPYDTVYTPGHMAQRNFGMINAKCVSESSACSSFINGLEIIEGYFASGKARKALIIGSEHNSAYSNDTDPQSGHLWGDGAIAMFLSSEKCRDNEASIVSIYTAGLAHIGKSDTAVHLFPKDRGIEMPEGRDVFMNACKYMVEALIHVTKDYDKTLDDLKFISPHQANKRIITTIASQNNIPEDKFLLNIETRGNIGSPSCAICLSENIQRISPNDLVAICVFGGGYSCGAALFQF